MHRLTLSYRWEQQPEPNTEGVTASASATPAHLLALGNPLMDLLAAVHDQGSISGAARALSKSYRHVWGELKRWELELAQPLVVWEKGQSATLSPFANKLLWAERQAQARLGPQIEALRSELNRCFAVAFDSEAHLLDMHASHDEGLSRLRQFTANQHKLHLGIDFMGSVDAVAALAQHRTRLAGFHLVVHKACDDPSTGAAPSLSEITFKPLLNPDTDALIGFATRRQGLMLAKGNPLGIKSVADVLRADLRFAHRSPGTGTRLLLQELLGKDGLAEPARWAGEKGESSHTAVAQAVLSGQADTGLGIEVAAAGKGLDFVPLVTEHYFLATTKGALASEEVQMLLGVLQAPKWQAEMALIPGYQPYKCGQVLALKDELGWW
jgi:putative molybdopterin biosynthesis protein